MMSHIISRVLPMLAIISAGSAYCVNGIVEQINGNKYTLLAIGAGTALSTDAAKAAVETLGVVCDSGNKMHPLTVPVNFGVNWVTRKAMRGMGANKIKLSGFGSAGNDVGDVAAEAITAAAPQLIAALAIMALNGSASSTK